jgi:hypothetical protein
VGAERLTPLGGLGVVFITTLGAALGACHPNDALGPTPPASRSVPHLQIVRAITTSERRALVQRFRARNAEGEWIVNEEALAESVVVVDPFRGFLRRAHRNRRVDAETPLSDDEVGSRARAFVARNADLFGLPAAVATTLGEDIGHDEQRIVHFDARFPSKGYEAFPELENEVDLDVVLDGAGNVVAFDNRSRLHPRLSIDVHHPKLAEDDPRVVSKIVGRKVFALYSGEPQTPVRELERIPLGEVTLDDVSLVQPIIHVSPGLRMAWLTYRLAYFVEIAKELPHAQVFYFRYVVDADTGDVIEDARAPVVSADGVGSGP